jgi:hypothetical protein
MEWKRSYLSVITFIEYDQNLEIGKPFNILGAIQPMALFICNTNVELSCIFSCDITILPKSSPNNDLNFVISSVVLKEMFTQMI